MLTQRRTVAGLLAGVGLAVPAAAMAGPFQWITVPQPFQTQDFDAGMNWLSLDAGTTGVAPGLGDDVRFVDLGTDDEIRISAGDTPFPLGSIVVSGGRYNLFGGTYGVTDHVHVGDSVTPSQLFASLDLGLTGELVVGLADDSEAGFRGRVEGQVARLGVGMNSVADAELLSGSVIDAVTLASGLNSTATLDIASSTEIGTLTLASAGATVNATSLSYGVVDNSNGGTFNWVAGSLTSMLDADFVFGAGGLLGESFVQDGGRTLRVNGDVVIDGVDAGYTLADGGVVAENIRRENGGTFTYTSGLLSLSGTGLDVAAGGLLGETFTSVFRSQQVFGGVARVDGAAASLVIDGGSFTAAGLETANGGTFEFRGGTFELTNDGFTVGDGGDQQSLAVSRREVPNGSSTRTEIDSFTVSGDLAVLENGTATVDRGTLRAGSLTVNGGGSFEFVSGTFELTNDGFTVGDGGDQQSLGLSARGEDGFPGFTGRFTVSGDLAVVENGELTIGRGNLTANALVGSGNGGIVADGAAGLIGDPFDSQRVSSIGTTVVSAITLTDQATMEHVGGQITVNGGIALSGDAVFTQSTIGEDDLFEEPSSGTRAERLTISDNAQYELLDRYAYLAVDHIEIIGNGVLDYQGGTLRTRDIVIGTDGLFGNDFTQNGNQNIDLQDSSLSINEGASFTMQGGLLTASAINNDGTFLFEGGTLVLQDALFEVSSGGLLGADVVLGNNSGPSAFQTIGDRNRFQSTTDVSIASGATLTVEDRGRVYARDTFLASGATLTIDGGRYGTGTLRADAGALVDFRAGTLRVTELDISEGGALGADVVIGEGQRRALIGSEVTISNGSLTFGSNGAVDRADENFLGLGTVDVESGGSLAITGGRFDIERLNLNGGTFEWTGGTLERDANPFTEGPTFIITEGDDLGSAITLNSGMAIDLDASFIGGFSEPAPGFQNDPSSHTSESATMFTRFINPFDFFGGGDAPGGIDVRQDGTLTVDGGSIDANILEVSGDLSIRSGNVTLRSYEGDFFNDFGDPPGELVVGSEGFAELSGGTLRVDDVRVIDGGRFLIDGGELELGAFSFADAADVLENRGVEFRSGTIFADRADLRDPFALRVGRALIIDGTADNIVVNGGTLNAGSARDTRFIDGELTVEGTFEAINSFVVDDDRVSVGGVLSVEDSRVVTVDGGTLMVGELSRPDAVRFERGDLEFTDADNVWATSIGSQADTVEVRSGDRLVNAGETTVGRRDTLEVRGEFSTGVLRLLQFSTFRDVSGTASIGEFINEGGSYSVGFFMGDVTQTEGSTEIEFVSGNVNIGGGSAVFVDIDGDLTITGGAVQAQNVFGNVSNTGDGVFEPGASPAITRVRDYVQGEGATLVLEIGGLIAGDEHDVLDIGGRFEAGGTLRIEAIDGFIPEEGAVIQLLDFSPDFASGAFDRIRIFGFRADTSNLLVDGTITSRGIPTPSGLAVLASVGLVSGVRRRRAR